MREILTVSTKGQIVIPRKFRKALGIDAGSKIFVHLEKDRIVIDKPGKSLLDFEGLIETSLPPEEERILAMEGLARHVLDGEDD